MTIAKISLIRPTVVLVGISGFCGLKQNGWLQRYTLSTEMCKLYCFLLVKVNHVLDLIHQTVRLK